MQFCTAVNCMDGRVQEPVIGYLADHFGARYVDMITEPGPNRILAEQSNEHLIASLLARIDISVGKHKSEGIAVVGHYDCAGNPTGVEEQAGHTREAVVYLQRRYRDVKVIGLWVDSNWQVSRIVPAEKYA